VFTYELTRRLDGAALVVNAVHPGLVATNFAMDNFKGILKPAASLYRGLAKRFARSPEQGADTIVWLASAPEAAHSKGLYYYDRQPIRSKPESYTLAASRSLWELSERLTGLSSPEKQTGGSI
jgi:short-subunit dehydrogenase